MFFLPQISRMCTNFSKSVTPRQAAAVRVNPWQRNTALPFWAGWHPEKDVLCRELTRIFAKGSKNSCEFAKFVAKVLRLPVKNGRTRNTFARGLMTKDTISVFNVMLGWHNEAPNIT
jgi:hypothetical protein